MSALSRGVSVALFSCLLGACAPRVVPEAMTQADAVAKSKAAQEAEKLAPQAYLEAEKLLAEARFLRKEGSLEEAGAAAEQAIAAYNQAFALTRVARAQERIERAEKERQAKVAEQARLDQLMAQVAADADAYEMRARAHLDQEPVEDVDTLTPERAKMRRLAAKQLAAEARLLCLSTELLGQKSQDMGETPGELAKLEKDLSTGSVRKDLLPRATELRAECLTLLTRVRRPVVKKAPESARSDRLLADLTKSEQLMAYRDDRGVVVNLGEPVDGEGNLLASTKDALQLLGGTAQAHSDFPVLLVVHTARGGQDKAAESMGTSAKEALVAAGAPQVRVHSVSDAQPVVSASIAGAASKNTRIEVIFVSPGR